MDVVARTGGDGPSGDALTARPPNAPHRFVVVAPQGLGDSLETTPMLAALRRAFPAARIETIVLRPTARDLFIGLPQLVDRVTYLPYWERGVPAFLRAAAALPRMRRVDAAFLTFPAARPVYAALTALVPARARYAHAYGSALARSTFGGLVRRVPIAPHHNVHRNLDLLRAANVDVDAPARYVVPATWGSPLDPDASTVVMHVGSIAHHGLEAKRWPEDRFAELGRRLRTRGFDVVVLAGPAEREESARVAAAIPGARVAFGTLEEATRTIARAAAVVANDNGIAHVAAGLGRPVLALFGPTPIEFGPFGPDAIAFRPTTCPPCFDILRTDASCKLGIDFACLKRDLDVDLVESRFVRMLASARAPGTTVT